MIIALSIAFIFVCMLLILLILIQRPKGGGLAGAFGGAGGSDQAMFGAKAGDALTWITVGLFICFLGLAMGLTWATQPSDTTDEPPAITLPVGEEATTETATDAVVETATKTATEVTDAPKADVTETVKETVDKVIEAGKEVVEEVTTQATKAVETIKTEIKTTPAPVESESK